jgi:cardiolipin synthase
MQRLLTTANAPLTTDNQVNIHCHGEKKWAAMVQDIKQAKHFIHLEYFIVRNDPTGERLVQVLAEQAARGVAVRLLCDGLGSIRLPKGFFTPLLRQGGQAAHYFPLRLGTLHRLNHRNHRKICVIDGNIGYVGGFNIGDEYAGLPEEFSAWRDLHLRIVGEAAANLNACFQQDWQLATGKSARLDGPVAPVQPATGNTAIQIVSSGPDTPLQPVRMGMLKMIHAAQTHVFLQTPYFIPDHSLIDALRMAALSGVKVRVILPRNADHPLVLPAGLSFVGELLPAGVEFFFYRAGFLHSKMLTVDGIVSTVGSANFDLRSFRLNYEVNAFVYDPGVARRLEEIFERDLARSAQLTLADYGRRGPWQRMKQSLARLAAPLL